MGYKLAKGNGKTRPMNLRVPAFQHFYKKGNKKLSLVNRNQYTGRNKIVEGLHRLYPIIIVEKM